MISAARASRLISKPSHKREVLFKDGNTNNIIEVIMHADKFSGKDTKGLADVFRRKPTEVALKELWEFVRNNIRYVADPPGNEMIKSPAQTWADRYGDCKSMSLFVGSVLKNLNVPFKYRFTGYAGDHAVTHVYVVADVNGKEIILDTVHDTFNEEVPYKFKKDMTKISYIHGPKVGQTQSRDIPAKKTPKPFINYGTMTAGEMRLMLMQDQLNILGNYYGDPGGEYQHAQQLITDALFNGLHRRNPSFVGRIPERIAPVLRAIRRSRKDTQPAGKLIVNRPNGIGNGFDPQSENFQIPMVDCDEKFLWRNPATTLIELKPEYSSGKGQKAYEACKNQNRYIQILNQHINDSSHHLLYEYLKNPNQQPSVVATKYVLHKGFVGRINGITDIERDNLRLWLRNGIMRHNVKKGTEPHSPEKSIQFLKQGKEHPGIETINGVPFAVFAAKTLVPILKALVAAIGATAALIAAMPSKDRKLIEQLNAIGTGAGSADTTDWWKQQGGGGGNGNGNGGGEENGDATFLKSSAAPLLLASAGLGLLLFGTKN